MCVVDLIGLVTQHVKGHRDVTGSDREEADCDGRQSDIGGQGSCCAMTFGVLTAWLLCTALTTQLQMTQRIAHSVGYGHADPMMGSALKSEHNRTAAQVLLPIP